MIPTWIIAPLIDEITPKLVGGVVKNIASSAGWQVNLNLSLPKGKESLFISLHPHLFSLFLTSPQRGSLEGDQRLLRFLSLLEGKTVEGIAQVENDRIINIRLSDGLEMEVRLFGQRSAILLYKGNDPLCSYPHENLFTKPKSSPKKRPSLVSRNQADVVDRLKRAPEDVGLARYLRETYMEMDPELAKALLLTSGLSPDVRSADLSQESARDLAVLLTEVGEKLPHPTEFYICMDDERYPRISPIPLYSALQCTEAETSPSKALKGLYTALESYYAEKGELSQFQTRLSRHRKALLTRLERLREDLARAEDSPRYRRYAETILFHLKDIPRGVEQVELADPYSETGETLSIPLNPQKSPQANARAYFRLAKRLKRAQSQIQAQINTADEELSFIPEEPPQDIEALRELADLVGLGKDEVKPKSKVRREGEKKLKGIISFPIEDGSIIYVGGDAQGNDRLTFRVARGDDLWFHVRDGRGSHVVLHPAKKGMEPSQKSILIAAGLAAYFSKLRGDDKVEVIYTKVKYVRRTKTVGLVTHSQERSILVKPLSPKNLGE